MSFYSYLTNLRNDTVELKNTMQLTVQNLIAHNTDDLKPGILLGMIQSGKTRAFTGVIAKCFDLNYDIAIVLTKNSVALVDQTMKRLKSEFRMPVERNRLYVWDVIKLQDGQLTGYTLSQKNIIVVKKENKNMEALESILRDVPFIQNKKILIVDDEADQASVSFYNDRTLEDGFGPGAVSSIISRIRRELMTNCSYLQVTATPYSLYLQPEELELNQEEYAPQRPAFTNILYPHAAYIGGEYYFEKSMDLTSPASFLHITVEIDELNTLNFHRETRKRDYDARLKANILNTDKLLGFRNSIFNYLVGGTIRQIQETDDDLWTKPYHSAFLMHTSQLQKVHKAQNGLVKLLVSKLAELNRDQLSNYLQPCYYHLSASINLGGFILPDFNTVIDGVMNALRNNHVGIIEVNSENQIAALLGDDGQLRLDNPFNIFVGGQSLDRGITIDHLIGFFYGRNPGTFQMDTVLQHSRMYGTRSIEDLTVTRFYTTANIYQAMRNMYWFDKDLRDDIIQNGGNARVRFIAKQGSTIVPCGPNKLRASNLCSFKAFSRMLPIGFQTKSNTDIRNIIEGIDQKLIRFNPTGQESFTMPYPEVKQIIDLIKNTYTYEPRFGNVGLDWNTLPFKKAIEIGLEKHNTNEVIIFHKYNRETSRIRQNSSFGDAPDDGSSLRICKNLAQNGPVLMLFKQNGNVFNGWRDAAFYWPLLLMPEKMPNYVYTEI